MIDKLSASQERRIIRGIEKAIAYTRSGSSPNDALVKVATELEFTPEITKRACEAFNKSKTVHVLTNRKSDDRAESFDHADPAEVVKSIFGSTEKKASLGLPKQDYSDIGLTTSVFEKAASTAAPAEDVDTRDRATIIKEASDVEYRRDMKRRMETLDNFDRQKSTVNQLRLSAQDSIEKAAEQMKYLKTKELNKIAHVIVNRYGEPGAKMLKVVGAKIQRDLPLEKTAHGAVLPFTSPYPELDQAIRYAHQYADQKDTLQKLAQEAGDFFFQKVSAPKFGEGAGFMAKALPAFGVGAASKGVQRGLSTIADEVERWNSIISPEPEPKLLKMMDPAFLGSIQKIDNMQGWVAVAADPGIKNYPVDDITEAYNNIINVAPSMREPAMRPALKSMVKRQLAQKQLMDPAEINQLADLEKAQVDMTKTRRELESAAIRDLTGGSGSGADLMEILKLGDPETRAQRAVSRRTD